jgi:Restriction endonuclease NaeI
VSRADSPAAAPDPAAAPAPATAADPTGQLPGQLSFPGLEPASADDGQQTLPGLEDLPPPPRPAGTDPALDRVMAALRSADPGGARMATAIRRAFDLLLDGQHTGRYRWDQLHKTEKTHAGTLVEIGIQRTLGLADGTTLDYLIAGSEVDCKFSHRGGGWMIPPEAEGRLLLLVQASDEDGVWSAGLVRASDEHLNAAGNRDLKRTLNDAGRAAIKWLARVAPLPENALLRLPACDIEAIFGWPKGQQRVNELFRRAQGRRISRAVVATVARQDDYMKRVRDGGGARHQLRDEGIVIFGDYAAHQALASALGLPVPGPGEFVSARLARRADRGDARDPEGLGRRVAARFVRLDGSDWLVASDDDPVQAAPRLPRP